MFVFVFSHYRTRGALASLEHIGVLLPVLVDVEVYGATAVAAIHVYTCELPDICTYTRTFIT